MKEELQQGNINWLLQAKYSSVLTEESRLQGCLEESQATLENIRVSNLSLEEQLGAARTEVSKVRSPYYKSKGSVENILLVK